MKNSIGEPQAIKENLVDMDKLEACPFKQLQNWFAIAKSKTDIFPEAMTLATVDANQKPHSRVVLMKHFSNEGIVFFTNYESQKGDDMLANPNVALLFYWPDLVKQIRIEGVIAKTSREVSEKYFASRPHNSQIGAIVSKQSQEIASREALLADFEAFAAAHQEAQMTCPDNWGGYIVKPNYFEFWQARDYRLHDRIVYTLTKDTWHKKRLAP